MTQVALLRWASGLGSRTVLALVASVLLASAGGAAAGTATAPKATPGKGQIVFVSTSSGSGMPRIELVDADGSHRHVLAEGYAPAWSPDGKRLAYWARAGASDDLVVLNLASGQRVRLLQTPASNAQRRAPAWSPDGRRIAFVAGGVGGGPMLSVVRVDDGAVTRLAPADPSGVSWSPDGRRIAFVDPQRRLAVADSLTGAVDILDAADDGDRNCATTTILPYPCGEATPAFSPDGQLIAYALYGPAVTWPPFLWIIRSDGTGPRAAGSPAVGADGPHWSPDGGAIAFAEGWSPCGYNVGCGPDGSPCPEGGCASSGIFRVGVEGGPAKQLTRRALFHYSSVTSVDGPPAWSSDGRAIAFARDDNVSREGDPGEPEGKGLWLVRADGRCPTRISSGRRTVTGPVAWRPRAGSPPARHCANLALFGESIDGLVGGTMEFSYGVSNLGDRQAHDILVSLTLPEAGGNAALKARWRKIVKWAPFVTVGGRRQPCERGNPARCRIAVMLPGATATVTFHGTVILQPESAVRRAGTAIYAGATPP